MKVGFFTPFFVLFALLLRAQDFEIYVSDAGNFNNPPWQILKFDKEGKNPTVFTTERLNWPQDILFRESTNEVWISNLGSGCITIHDATTGKWKTNFACSIAGPTRIKIGPDSLLYVLQWKGNGKVLRYTLEGKFVDEFTETAVKQSIGLDWDQDGNLYVSSYQNDHVYKFDSLGLDSGVFIGSNLLGPTNIWFDAKGDLLVADYDDTSVKRFDAQGNYLGPFMKGLKSCEGVAYLPDGNILIGNGSTQSVKMYNTDGKYVRDFIASGSGG